MLSICYPLSTYHHTPRWSKYNTKTYPPRKIRRFQIRFLAEVLFLATILGSIYGDEIIAALLLTLKEPD